MIVKLLVNVLYQGKRYKTGTEMTVADEVGNDWIDRNIATSREVVVEQSETKKTKKKVK